MNNNTFVQLLMDIEKKKKTKQNLKAKGLNEITYSRGNVVTNEYESSQKKRETSKYSTRIIYDFNERFLHTLRARKQKQKPRRYCAQ